MIVEIYSDLSADAAPTFLTSELSQCSSYAVAQLTKSSIRRSLVHYGERTNQSIIFIPLLDRNLEIISLTGFNLNLCKLREKSMARVGYEPTKPEPG